MKPCKLASNIVAITEMEPNKNLVESFGIFFNRVEAKPNTLIATRLGTVAIVKLYAISGLTAVILPIFPNIQYPK